MSFLSTMRQQLASQQQRDINFADLYRFIPITTKNIGKNLLKGGKKNWKRVQARGHKLGLRECKRRVVQIRENMLQVSEVKVTPRREKDFTGKAWRRLNVSA
jgi:hypothetical protein